MGVADHLDLSIAINLAKISINNQELFKIKGRNQKHSPGLEK